MKRMYPAYNSQSTQLTADISAATGSIPVADAAVFPPGPNYATIGTDNAAEVVLYEEVDIQGGRLLGAVRGRSFTVPRGWALGSEVYHCDSADNLNAIMQNVEELDAGKAGLAGPVFTEQPHFQNAQTPLWHTGNLPVAQGVWKPVLQGLNAPGSFTYSTQAGNYIRIHNLVMVNGQVNTSARTAEPVERLLISSLPFPVLRYSCPFFGGTAHIYSGFHLGASKQMSVSPTSNGLELWCSDTAGGAYDVVTNAHIPTGVVNLYFSATYITT